MSYIHSRIIRNFKHSTSGVAAIEFALIAPVFLLILFAVIEFGLYFVKTEMVERTVSHVDSSLQLNPTGTDIADIVNSASN